MSNHYLTYADAKSAGCTSKSFAQRRIVRIFITDPDADLPIEHAVLYRGDELLTDSTDSELFLALNIPALLEKHNAQRDKLGFKTIRPRDLRMAIATLVYV